MPTRASLVFFALSLFCFGCSTPSTLEERMAVVAPMFSEQLDNVEMRLNSVRNDFHNSNFSADATLILDRLAMNISSTILEARFGLVRAYQELDTTALRGIGSEIDSLHVKTAELEYLASDAEAVVEDS